ncbi:MAG: ATP-binding protein [Actinobacteria bacterium]|nr:ATP-binding protein [Actinomycetota bacterium]
MLWGRNAEADAIRAVVDGAREGRSGSLCVRGDVGIGKTALLDEAAEGAHDCTVRRTAGVESEATVAFGGLYGLLRPLADRIEELPASQTAALQGALGLAPPVGVERFAIGAATLSLLSLVGDARPVVCVVDDLHWLDPGSRDAILFATRRLGPEGIAGIFGMRDPEGLAIDTSGVPDLRLKGIDTPSAVALLAAHGPDLSSAVAQRAGRAPIGDQLDVGSALARAYRARLDALSSEERHALLLIALDETGDPAVLAAAFVSLGLTPSHLDAAEQNRFVVRDRGARMPRTPAGARRGGRRRRPARPPPPAPGARRRGQGRDRPCMAPRARQRGAERPCCVGSRTRRGHHRDAWGPADRGASTHPGRESHIRPGAEVASIPRGGAIHRRRWRTAVRTPGLGPRQRSR